MNDKLNQNEYILSFTAEEIDEKLKNIVTANDVISIVNAKISSITNAEEVAY